MVATHRRSVMTRGQGDAHDVTDVVSHIVADSHIASGTATVSDVSTTAPKSRISVTPATVVKPLLPGLDAGGRAKLHFPYATLMTGTRSRWILRRVMRRLALLALFAALAVPAAALASELKAAADRGEPDNGTQYYHHWLATLERLVTNKGLTDREAMRERKEAWADAYRHTPHGKPVELRK